MFVYTHTYMYCRIRYFSNATFDTQVAPYALTLTLSFTAGPL